MRFSRLKKNIEGALAGGPKGTIPFTKVIKAHESKSTVTTLKKRRRLPHQEDESSSLSELESEIENIDIRFEGKNDTFHNKLRLRGKKIDVKPAFESDSSITDRAHEDDESNDDYKTEGISEDEEESQVDHDEGAQPVSKRRKRTNQSAGRSITMISTSKSTPASRKASSTALRPNLIDDINKTTTTAMRSATPDLKSFVREEKVAWSAKLPPTPQSGPSLLDMIDEKVVRAEFNLGFGSPRPNQSRARSRSISVKTSSTNILPSVEQDEEANEDEAMSEARSNTTTIISVPSNDQQESMHSIPGALQTETQLPAQEVANTTESCVVQ